jgi:gamma-glutamyltranspeptidase / glutathione hydrolase
MTWADPGSRPSDRPAVMDQDPQCPTRHAVLATGYMVAASHPAVAAAGARVLSNGGNAIDATLAMAAMCWIALPGQCGVGGDAFALVREPDGSVWTAGGSGYGPDGGDPGFYRGRGLSAIPLTGPLAAAVPGAMAALAVLHGRGATRALDELWAPAITSAERGMPCTAKTRADIIQNDGLLRGDAGTRESFLPGGRVPAIGEAIRQPRLASTVRVLARDPARFYRGDLAERAVTALTAGGAPFSGEEWALSGAAVMEPAITGRYGGLVLHETPMPTPGWMVLQQAALCDRQLTGLEWLGADAVHWLAGAARRAFRDRFERCGSDSGRWRELLTGQAVAAGRRDLLACRTPMVTGVRPDGDTTSTVAVDAQGRAVSFIQSLALTFGAGMTVPGTGIVLNNRLGRGAYLVDGHPNEVRPRRRPLHTLNAWLLADDRGRLHHIGNTPGGDGQVQWNMQLVSHLADHGLDPQQAVSAPRFTVYPGSDADAIGAPGELRCESRLGERTLAGLAQRGEAVRALGPWAAGGSALVISADHHRGCLAGAADPRQDGIALGI